MSLINLIQTHAAAEAEARNFAAALQSLQAAQTPWVNPAGITLADIGLHISVAAQAVVSETLRQIDTGALALPEAHAGKRGLISDARRALTLPTGLLIGQQDRQDLIALIGAVGGWPAELVSAVQSLGRRQVSVLEAAGYSGMTAAGLQAAWDHHRVQQMRQQWRDVAAQVEAVISAADLGRAEAVVAAVQSALEG